MSTLSTSLAHPPLARFHHTHRGSTPSSKSTERTLGEDLETRASDRMGQVLNPAATSPVHPVATFKCIGLELMDLFIPGWSAVSVRPIEVWQSG